MEPYPGPVTRPRLRRATSLVGAAVLAVTLSACATQGPPEVTFYSDRTTVVTGPQVLCSLDFTTCTQGEAAQLDVPPGDVLQVSLPSEIFNAPWRMLTAYTDAQGDQQVRDDYYRPGARLAVTVDLGDPASVLQFVEIQLPSGATNADGTPVARGSWSVQNSYDPHSG